MTFDRKKPDVANVEVLNQPGAPNFKQNIASFLPLMQPYSDFILNHTKITYHQ